jgi:hypothetical protein
VTFSVVSEYARSLLPLGTICHVGRLDGEEMLAFIREENPHRVVDATHPYAVLASQNIRQCCDALNIAYERIHFEDIDNAWRDAVEWVDSREQLITAVLREKGNMLLGIGRDPIFPMPAEADLTRLYPRIAPIPASLQVLVEQGLLSPSEVTVAADDNALFTICTVSVDTLLTRGGVASLTDENGQTVPIDKYGKWYLYAVGEICGLYRMVFDGAQPGIGISFVAFDLTTLTDMLEGKDTNGYLLYKALRSVTVSSDATRHSTALTAYFADPVSEGAYHVAEVYLSLLVQRAEHGILAAPTHYGTCSVSDQEYARVVEALRYLSSLYPDLILWENERPTGIRVANPMTLTPPEKQAILSLYTMNVTECSFAAEVAAHALGCDDRLMTMLGGYERWKISDMAVGFYSNAAGTVARMSNEFGFYNLNSTAVKSQEAAHPYRKGEYAVS